MNSIIKNWIIDIQDKWIFLRIIKVWTFKKISLKMGFMKTADCISQPKKFQTLCRIFKKFKICKNFKIIYSLNFEIFNYQKLKIILLLEKFQNKNLW